MVVLIDSREQRGLRFQTDAILTETRVVTLPVGDYGCEFIDGHRPPLIFERKGLHDLFGTMTRGYPRFKRELMKAKDLNLRLILLIEGTMADVYAGVPQSSWDGDRCMQKIFTLWVRYGLQPVFCASRSEMTAFIVETFEGLGRERMLQQQKALR